MSPEQPYVNLYQANRDSLIAVSPKVMNTLRDEAINVFAQKGFPSRKVEAYRYIDVPQAFEGKDSYAMPQPTLPLSAAQQGVITLNDEVLLNKYYAKAADNEDAITALNTAFSHECICIHLGKNQVLDRPIELTDMFASEEDQMEHKRILIVLEEGASASIMLRYAANNKTHILTTQVVEVFVGDNARLELYELEETHTSFTRFNNVYLQLGRYANVKHNNITLFNGCVMADKSQVVDNNTLIRHEVPNCTSHELYKYVVDEQSVGAFAGKVYVAEGAQKTVSEEVNQNICASDDARMYTQPMLEIYADDVKCSHGSTVGKLDDMALFYMRQRGIPLAEARMLLMQAFVGQVIDEIPIAPLRDRLHIMIEQRLKGELDKCVGCARCK